MPKSKREQRKYSTAFITDALARLRDEPETSLRQHAKDLGVSHSTLSGWSCAERKKLVENNNAASEPESPGTSQSSIQENTASDGVPNEIILIGGVKTNWPVLSNAICEIALYQLKRLGATAQSSAQEVAFHQVSESPGASESVSMITNHLGKDYYDTQSIEIGDLHPVDGEWIGMEDKALECQCLQGILLEMDAGCGDGFEWYSL